MSHRRLLRRSLAVGLAIGLAAPYAGSTAATAATAAVTPPPIDQAVVDGTAWLVTQQQADGGYEVSGFPGFETPDAVLALAAGAQDGPIWNTAMAIDAVTEAQPLAATNPLDYLDDLVDGGDPTTVAAAARAAKIVALDTWSLGLDPHDFDPSNDSASPVDLVARFQARQQPDGSYAMDAQFNGVLYAAIALHESALPVPAGLVAQIRDAQRPDGSWNYAGDQDADTGGDVDTTSTALLALRAAGLTRTDGDVAQGIAFLATQQDATGAFTSFGSGDANSTAVATIALSALHVDVTTAAWRATAGHPVSGAYPSPDAWLRAQQLDSGRFASPNDAYPPINTFATSQSLQALARQWYLADDRAAYLDGLATRLAQHAAPYDADAVVLEGSASLGANPSVESARNAASYRIVATVDGRKLAAQQLFQQAFGRAIDPSGSAYWSKKLVSLSRPQVLARLTGSSEFYRKAGGTIPSFVDAVYQRVLGRAPDAGGRAYWIKKLQGGEAVYHVAASLVTSNEYLRRTAEGAYQQVLDRAPTATERTFTVALLGGQRVEVVLARLAATAEAYDLFTTEV